MKPVYSAYAPPSPKKRVKVARTRYYKKRGHAAREATESAATEAPAAPAPPAGVPSLADVPQGSAPAAAQGTSTAAAASSPSSSAATAAKNQVASAKAPTMKPGKKEKIRFGQAPRETLPKADTKSEDAAAPGTAEGSQVAANNTPSDLKTLNPDGSVASSGGASEKKVKTRLSARARQPKNKKDKNDPFAPPPITPDEVATQKQQAKPLGLNGDTSKQKKANAAKTGPKRRLTDEKKDKDKDQGQPAPGDNGTPASPSATPAPAAQPAPTQP
jgi:peptidyl-prolyl cis-trans isomerase SurA